ncbi:hypothetical protein [Algoriphagus antarcticus]|uniref:Uncharacterized protein n=1 Tax=Algoriphagus antarcticus TaxID=238540 RepID=A0A3E0DY30_9BACT|nr:hypothetical protein [Algoriphagus antarcticus]REG88479.1 hypothetical protein C8N25_10994 [Algoriphagus antarcticus]
MKKALSIFLLGCFVLYHFGYYAFYFSYDQHLERKWVDIIYSENSIPAQETLIEIPLLAPYMANQELFQPTNTSFEKDGQFFRAIKQRYQNDTLQIIVVPDTARGVLDSTVKKWISFLTEDDIPLDQNGKTVIKLLVKDYLQPVPFFFEVFANTNLNSKIELVINFYLDPVHGIESPPPLFS